MVHDSRHFVDRLDAAIAGVGSPVCVGLDPVLDRLPGAVRAAGAAGGLGAIEAFSRGVIEAVAGQVAAVKFQSACYERWGGAGLSVLADLARRAEDLGLVVILDAKRGDIGISAEHYAAAALAQHADAITVNGYLGPSGVLPFLEAGLGVFVLVRTSNPDSDSVQSVRLADGRSVAEMMADHVAHLGRDYLGSCGLSDAGAVVGLTKAGDGPALRARMPDQVFLIPGYGAQGGSPGAIRALLRADGRGVLVSASRSVIYPPDGDTGDWRSAVIRAAERFAGEVSGALAGD